MSILYTILIALSNNIDNIGARIALSIKGIKISNLINLWISCITFVISLAAACVGEWLHGQINWNICKYISFTIFLVMGVCMICEPYYKTWKKNRGKKSNQLVNIIENPEEADINKSKDIDFKEATLLGIALSINNVGGSFSAGMIGLNSWLIGIFSAAVSFIALWAGNYLSSLSRKFRLASREGFLSGIILILIALRQIL